MPGEDECNFKPEHTEKNVFSARYTLLAVLLK